jgi:hypothetical protein
VVAVVARLDLMALAAMGLLADCMAAAAAAVAQQGMVRDQAALVELVALVWWSWQFSNPTYLTNR